MLRRSFIVFTGACALFATSAAHADPQSGLSLGLRAGYALPAGKVGRVSSVPMDKQTDLSDSVKGAVPLWLDAGFRVNPSIYVGGSFQYAFAFVNKDGSANGICNSLDCSARDISFGANLHYHVMPGASFDPWVGLGVGYEILTASISGTTMGQKIEADSTLKGLQFVTLQLGGDIAASPAASIGPYVNVTVGKYSSYSMSAKANGRMVQDQSGDLEDTALYEWITFGLRGSFNL